MHTFLFGKTRWLSILAIILLTRETSKAFSTGNNRLELIRVLFVIYLFLFNLFIFNFIDGVCVGGNI
jgi:hypothetical protein